MEKCWKKFWRPSQILELCQKVNRRKTFRSAVGKKRFVFLFQTKQKKRSRNFNQRELHRTTWKNSFDDDEFNDSTKSYFCFEQFGFERKVPRTVSSKTSRLFLSRETFLFSFLCAENCFQNRWNFAETSVRKFDPSLRNSTFSKFIALRQFAWRICEKYRRSRQLHRIELARLRWNPTIGENSR